MYSTTAGEMNGKKGKLLCLKQQTGRWAVKLEGVEQPMHLLETNLKLAIEDNT